MPHPDLAAVQSTTDAFLSRETISRPLARLRRLLPAEAEILLTGGAIRNVVIGLVHGKAPATYDLDLFIKNLTSTHPIQNGLPQGQCVKTDLGGMRWFPEGSRFAFDICPLAEFVMILKYRLPPNTESLLTSIDFTINAVVYNLARGRLFEHGCLEAVHKRWIEFNTRRFMSKLLLAYRILLMHNKTGFVLSKDVFSFLKYHLDLKMLNDLSELVISKQHPTLAAKILEDADDIARAHNHQDYVHKRRKKGGLHT